jgi:DNA-directed RNA polymerase subunit RPC12/RpoP
MESIFIKLNSSSLKEEELDSWVLQEVYKHYQPKIDYLANRTYGYAASFVAKASFHALAKGELRNALHTFLFKKQHQFTGRDINPYLITSLNRLADRIYYDNSSAKKIAILVCPLCKEENQKAFLIKEDKLWRCDYCSDKADKLSEMIKSKSIDNKTLSSLSPKYILYNTFSLHSKKGYKCPECSKFIPQSAITNNGICCPYEDCLFFGKIEDLEMISHPSSLIERHNYSLQAIISDNSEGTVKTFQDIFQADVLQADARIDVHERNNIEYTTLMQVIDDQIKTIKRMNSAGTLIQKSLMYEAYKIMLEKFPEETISYLVHQKQKLDFPIQSRIFQEYTNLIENYLPFSIKKKGEMIDIVDLLDPDLSLFLGKSEYEALVKTDHTIPNNTKETYTGGRKFKEYGPCFIGKLIDIIDVNTGKSIKDAVIGYSFVSISLNDGVLPGTKVAVTHYRIASHYEINNLVLLQRSRRKIVDSVYMRLNKIKRIPKGKSVK